MTSKSWDGLNLTPWLRDAIASLGFEEMTPVQANTIPLFIKHKDVVVEAVTGSGKTLAFLIPLIERILHREDPLATHHVGGLVICPTRELAMQIHTVFHSLIAFASTPDTDTLQSEADDVKVLSIEDVEDNMPPSSAPEPYSSARKLGLSAQLLIGGNTSVQQDVLEFRSKSPTILIGTPGRIHDLLNTTSNPKFSDFEVLIMDEADRLLDMGFQDVLHSIIGKLPKQRRTGLFSATMTDAVTQLVRTGLRNPVKIVVHVKAKAGEDKRTPTSLKIGYMLVKPAEKTTQLIRLLHYSLNEDHLTKSIVYFPTCAAVDYFQPLFARMSQLKSFTIIPLHGKQAPSVRQKNFKRFVSLGAGTPSVLLTTDLAARGLDVPDVDLVIQIDPPQDPSAFSHRCGRAGRAGRPGKAILLLNEGREEEYVPFLEVRKTPVSCLPRLTSTNQIVLDSTEDLSTGTDLINNRMRALVRKDRDLYERGMKAFVSYIRFYSKHHAAYIFRLRDLDLSGAAAAHGLLRLPTMPELKGQDVSYDNEAVDMKTFAYADKVREAARLEALKKEAEAHPDGIDKPTQKSVRESKKVVPAWSHKVDAHDRKEARREKKKRKREAVEKTKLDEKAASRPADQPSASSGEEEDDWKELRKERKLANRSRRNKAEIDAESENAIEISGGMFDDM